MFDLTQQLSSNQQFFALMFGLLVFACGVISGRLR